MPIVATVGFDLLDMTVLRLIVALSQHHALVGQEHGRTIPLTEEGPRIDVFTLGLSANSNSDIAKKRLRETAGKLRCQCPKSSNKQVALYPRVVPEFVV